MAWWFTQSLGNEDSQERGYQRLLLHVLDDDRHEVGGREKKMGRDSEREQSVSCLRRYLSNLIFQLVLVELNTVLEETEEREKTGGENVFQMKSDYILAARYPRYMYIMSVPLFSENAYEIGYIKFPS